MRRLLKGLFLLIFAVVPILIVGGGLGVLWLSRSLPAASGTVTLNDLSGPVSISRDEHGVPHIRGETREDVLAALGFAHAQDRLWQMEVSRMAGQGRLSELFGSATLSTDVWLRTIAIYQAAEASYAAFPPEAKEALTAYARGVNAWLEREPRLFAAGLPPEFVILGHEPEPWRPEDSVVVVKMMSVGLAANIGDEINRLALTRAGFSAAEIDDLMPMLPGETPPPLPDLNVVLGYGAADEGQARVDAGLQEQAIEIGGLTGRGASNNWVISGDRTTSGAPILANDPHLGLAAPSVWYLAHLRVEEGDNVRNLVGATLAGAPLVLLGRNDDIAWGFTNTGADVQDLFVERINPNDPDEYQTPEGWAAFGTAEETIRIDGGDHHVFQRRFTRHGPVMPGGYRNLEALLPEGTVGALQWVALAEDDTTMIAGLGLWDVETVEDFKRGMRDFVTPMQSIVIADRAGDIGLIAPGRVPVRGADNDIAGRAPVPGWDAAYDWQGFIPFDDLPRASTPARGAIGTANTRLVPADYRPLLTYDWDEPYRQRRVDELILDRNAPHDVAASQAAQLDIRSTGLAEILPLMLGAVEGREGLDPFVTAALGDWDFMMDRDRPEPLIATAWLRHAMIAIFEDDLGNAFDGWFEARGEVMRRVLTGDGVRDWCDRRGTDAPEDCASVLAESLGTALAELEGRYGNDRTAWRWGEAHVAVGEHRPFGQVPPLDRLFNVSVASGGDAFTLDRGRTSLNDDEAPYANRHASSYRAIYPLDDLDASLYMTTTGQSGNVFSRHYRDLAEPWADGNYIVIPTDPGRYEGEAAGTWQLVP
jgi:penicillin amidase